MKPILLRPQLASQLPDPPDGYQRLLLDSTTGTLGLLDQDGIMHPVGSGGGGGGGGGTAAAGPFYDMTDGGSIALNYTNGANQKIGTVSSPSNTIAMPTNVAEGDSGVLYVRCGTNMPNFAAGWTFPQGNPNSTPFTDNTKSVRIEWQAMAVSGSTATVVDATWLDGFTWVA